MSASGDAMRIGLVAGLTFFALVYMLYSTSGAHINPAVTLGVWASRRMTTLRAFCYISACAFWMERLLAVHPKRSGGGEMGGL